MNGSRSWLAALVPACLFVTGCARVSVEPLEPLEQPGQDLAVLLQDSRDGTVGRAIVSNALGTADLAEARASTRVSPNHAPSAVRVLSEEDVQRVFGGALASLPPAPETFTLYFRFESQDLTAESRAVLADTLRAVQRRPVPDVLVVGHTDTTGSPESNFALATRRANAVRALLLAAGLDADAVTVASHGESQPLVPTPDGFYEPRNRRVHITVR